MDGGGADEAPAWRIGKDSAWVGYSAEFEAWAAWEFKNRLPEPGGLFQQPLALMTRLAALSAVYHTWQAKIAKDADFSKFSPTQRAIIRWMESP